MRTKRFLAAATVSAALVTGGVAGFVLGVPGVSGAQTPDTTTPPSTGAPADEGTAPDSGGRSRENCPDKEGGAPGGAAEGTGIAVGFRRL